MLQPSKGALFEFLAADLVRTDGKVDMISQRVEFPPELTKEKLFIINAQVRPALFCRLDAVITNLVIMNHSLTAASFVRAERVGRRLERRAGIQPRTVLEDPRSGPRGVSLRCIA